MSEILAGSRTVVVLKEPESTTYFMKSGWPLVYHMITEHRDGGVDHSRVSIGDIRRALGALVGDAVKESLG